MSGATKDSECPCDWGDVEQCDRHSMKSSMIATGSPRNGDKNVERRGR